MILRVALRIGLLATSIVAPLGACGASPRPEARSQGDPLKDTDPDELFAQGMRFSRGGDFIRAEQYFVAAVDRGYPERQVVPVLIDVCIRSSRFDSALSHARPQLERDPGNWHLRFVVATLQAALGKTELAQVELERVLMDAPEAPEPHFTLGRILWDSNPDAARLLFARYLALSPEGKHAAEAMALLRMDSKAPFDELPTDLKSIERPEEQSQPNDS